MASSCKLDGWYSIALTSVNDRSVTAFKSGRTSWHRLMCLQPGVNANNKETLATLDAAGIRG